MKNAAIIEIIVGAILLIYGGSESGIIGSLYTIGAFALILSGIGLLSGYKQIKKLRKELENK